MITKLLRLRSILRYDDSVNMTKTLKVIGLNRKDLEKLVSCGVIKKTGSTKGAKWYWIGGKPTYNTIKEWINDDSVDVETFLDVDGSLSLINEDAGDLYVTSGGFKNMTNIGFENTNIVSETNKTSLFDLVFNKFNLQVWVSFDVRLKFDGENKVIITRDTEERITTEVTNVESLDSILSLLT
jgi:hypothetical protein